MNGKVATFIFFWKSTGDENMKVNENMRETKRENAIKTVMTYE